MATSNLPRVKVTATTPGEKKIRLVVYADNLASAEKVIAQPIKPEPVPPVALSPLFGFGAAATGGAGGDIAFVDTYAQFKSAGQSDNPLIIIARKTINGVSSTVDYGFNAKSNKTILALPGVLFNGFGIWWNSNKENVILRNLSWWNMPQFADGVFRDYNTFKTGFMNGWVDHCVFNGGSPGLDGCLDITEGSDLMTVTNCQFKNEGLASLVGLHAGTSPNQLRVTYDKNYFLNCFERQPKFTSGTGGHVMNGLYEWDKANVVSGYKGNGIGSSYGGVVRTDNNFFKASFKGNPLYSYDGPSLDGVVRYGAFSGADTNYFEAGCGSNQFKGVAPSDYMPPYEFASRKLPVMDVPNYVYANSGDILTLDQMGIVI